jgi:Holliday junction DNA helicase RuvA
MIAKLSGIVDRSGADGSVIIDVSGVGYLVFCSARTLRLLPAAGEAAKLFIDTHVREDHIHLYGFIDEAERNAYRVLTTVQGVGAKLALAICAVLSPDALAAAILAQDKAALAQADGVGPKLAARIVNELRDKVGGLTSETLTVPVAAVAANGGEPGAASDAISALVNLGYRRADASGAVSRAARKLGADAGIDALIRGGLKELAS